MRNDTSILLFTYSSYLCSVSVLSLKIPIALTPIERVGPAFPAFFLKSTVEFNYNR